MANASKQKGDRAERAVVEYLRARGLDAYRIKAGARSDLGDIGLNPDLGFLIEVRDRKRLLVAEWWRSTRERAAALGRRPLLICKLPRHPNPGDWLWVCSAEIAVGVHLPVAGGTEGVAGAAAVADQQHPDGAVKVAGRMVE